jgi:uncharacterized protein
LTAVDARRHDGTMTTADPPAQGWWYRSGPDLVVRLRVQPRASHPGIVGVEGDRLKLRVSAPPVDGDANRAVIELVSSVLRMARGRLSIERGGNARNKDLRIASAAGDAESCISRLQSS